MPPSVVWSYGNIPEPRVRGDFQKTFPGGSGSEQSLEGRYMMLITPVT